MGLEKRDARAATLVAVCAALLAWTQFADGDLGFHLATGREILATGTIPRSNVLSFTNPDFPWLLHQWLPGVLFEWLYRHGGAGPLQALKVALVVATWLVSYAAARFAGAGAVAAALGTVLAAGGAAFRFELRPYLFTHLSLAGSVACCAHVLRAAGPGARPVPRALLGAGAIPAIACHLHAGALDGWLVLGALAFGCLVEPLRARLLGAAQQAPSTARAAASVVLVLLGSVGLAALSLALYHPYGARVLLFPFDMGSDAYLAEHLLEFRPPTRFPLEVLAPYWLLVGLVLGAWLLRARTLHAFWPVVVLGFLMLSLRHARLAFGFAVVSAPLAALGVERVGAQLRSRALGATCAALALLAVLGHRAAYGEPGTGFVERTFPVRLFALIDRLQGHAYVSDAWAGPLLGHSYPRRKAFFDNRFEAYPRDFFVNVYQHIRYGRPGWDTLLDRHHVEIVLMRYTSPGEARFQGGRPNLRQLLVRDPRWALVQFDELGAVYVRREGANAAIARTEALPGVDPDRMQFLAPPRSCRAALRAALARGSRSRRLLLLAAASERDAGDLAAAQRLMAEAATMPEGPW